MSLRYELRVHDRDVNIGGSSIGKHTGYDLIIYDGDKVIEIRSIDLNGSSPIGHIEFKEYSGKGYIQVGDNIAPIEIFKDGQWQNVTPEWLEENNYISRPLPIPSDEVEKIFDKIRENAELIEKFKENGFPIKYDPTNQNCNSWAAFININFFPDIDIFGILNEGFNPPKDYVGANKDFPYIQDGLDDEILDLIWQIQSMLKEYGLNLEDIELNIFNTLGGLKFIICFNEFEMGGIAERENFMPNPIVPIGKLVETGEITRSPLIVDLDGDGVETTGTYENIYFDHDGNGFAEKSGWVGKDDGLLVRDINENGQIDDGTELFGNNSVLSSGKKAENGFEALKDLDSNHDNVFDNKDAAWNEVKVWKDSNQNGLVEEGELFTLEQANVSGINPIFLVINSFNKIKKYRV